MVTVLPGVGRFKESFSVTVIVAGVCPSAGTVAGFALMPALAAAGTPNVRLTAGSTNPSVTSVGVKVTVSGTASVTVNVTAPSFTLEAPLDAEMTALPDGA